MDLLIMVGDAALCTLGSAGSCAVGDAVMRGALLSAGGDALCCWLCFIFGKSSG